MGDRVKGALEVSLLVEELQPIRAAVEQRDMGALASLLTPPDPLDNANAKVPTGDVNETMDSRRLCQEYVELVPVLCRHAKATKMRIHGGGGGVDRRRRERRCRQAEVTKVSTDGGDASVDRWC